MSSEASRPVLGLSPLRQLIQRVLSPGAERVEREADHSLLSSTEFEN